MDYVPEGWYSAKYRHSLSKYRLRLFRTMHTCTCGATGWSKGQLWQAHVRIEHQLAQAMKTIEEARAKRWRVKIDAEKAKINIPTPRRVGPTNNDSGTLNNWDIK